MALAHTPHPVPLLSGSSSRGRHRQAFLTGTFGIPGISPGGLAQRAQQQGPVGLVCGTKKGHRLLQRLPQLRCKRRVSPVSSTRFEHGEEKGWGLGRQRWAATCKDWPPSAAAAVQALRRMLGRPCRSHALNSKDAPERPCTHTAHAQRKASGSLPWPRVARRLTPQRRLRSELIHRCGNIQASYLPYQAHSCRSKNLGTSKAGTHAVRSSTRCGDRSITRL